MHIEFRIPRISGNHQEARPLVNNSQAGAAPTGQSHLSEDQLHEKPAPWEELGMNVDAYLEMKRIENAELIARLQSCLNWMSGSKPK
jgi:hypothetical protein